MTMSYAVGASLWCAHPRIQPGEAFSSWLHRCAVANGMADHTYCRHVFGTQPIWNRDIDHLADTALLSLVARATGEHVERLQAGTLQVFQGRLFNADRRGGHFPWILSLGIYHRLRRAHGQQFCPQCLRQAPVRLQLAWRLAFVVCCPVHGCFLCDACPKCDTPLLFHRMTLTQPLHLDCRRCGQNLMRAPTLVAPQRTVRFQRRLQRALRRGVYTLPDGDVPAAAFFMGLRILARGVFNRRHLIGLQDTLPDPLRRQAPKRPVRLLEHARLPERHFVLETLRRTLRGWPRSFVAPCRRAGIYAIRFSSRSGQAPPAWLAMGLQGVRRHQGASWTTQ